MPCGGFHHLSCTHTKCIWRGLPFKIHYCPVEAGYLAQWYEEHEHEKPTLEPPKKIFQKRWEKVLTRVLG
jgi:hypothetical protein